MTRRSLLAVAPAALILSACTGRVIQGLPLDAGDDETTADPATVVLDSGTYSLDAGAQSARLDSGLRDGGQRTDADGRDAGSANASPTPTADAGAQTQSVTRDLSTDKTKFLGEPRCPAAAALLCDDFESEQAGAGPDSAVWSTSLGYVPNIDTTRAARGSKSLHFHVEGGAPGHIEETKTFPAASDVLYGRMFVWFGALPSGPDMAKWALVAGAPAEGAEVRVGGQYLASDGNHDLWGVGSNFGSTGDWFRPDRDPQGAPQTGAWICLEWLFNGSSDEMQVWLDAVEQPSLHTTATDYLEGDEMGQIFNISKLTKLDIGWWAYESDTVPSPIDVWIDEVVIDDERIGCVL